MNIQDGIIEGTAQEVIAQLAHVPPDQHVRVLAGRPSLSIIARQLQATAEKNGMTDAIHDNMLRHRCM